MTNNHIHLRIYRMNLVYQVEAALTLVFWQPLGVQCLNERLFGVYHLIRQMTQTSFCLGTICNVAHTKNLWHSTEINVFVHSSCFFNDETPMAQRYKKKCRREEIYDDFLFEGISATGKKKLEERLCPSSFLSLFHFGNGGEFLPYIGLAVRFYASLRHV